MCAGTDSRLGCAVKAQSMSGRAVPSTETLFWGMSCVRRTVYRPPQQKPATPTFSSGDAVRRAVRKARTRGCAMCWRLWKAKRRTAGMKARVARARVRVRVRMFAVGGGVASAKGRTDSGIAWPGWGQRAVECFIAGQGGT
jgi:hypothetical protein